jgi:hypothetical protein
VDGFSQACGVASAYLFCDPIGDRWPQVSAMLLVIFEILRVWTSTRILKAPSLAGVHHQV